jgi:hypothetical protein
LRNDWKNEWDWHGGGDERRSSRCRLAGRLG